MRVALVQMPFFTLDSPSLALSMLQAALQAEGHSCDIKYLNLDFGERLGVELYSSIAAWPPNDLLLGDLVFGSCVFDSGVDRARLRELASPGGTRSAQALPEPIVEIFPELALAAKAFVLEAAQSTQWSEYDLIGLSSVFTITPVLALAKALTERRCPPLILGGPYLDAEMGEALFRAFPAIDFVARGEGERLIVELAARLESRQTDLSDVKGLLWRDARGNVHVNGEASLLHPGKATLAKLGQARPATPRSEFELDALPIPRFDRWLEEMRVRKLVPEQQLRLPIQTSRGCWYGEKHHCTFCGLNDATIAYRRKSPARALEEFRQIVDTGVKSIVAADDIMDFRYFDSLLPELAPITRDIEIFYEVKANLSWSDVERLKRAGIVWLQPGIESLSTPLLRLMDKGVTAFQNARLLRYGAELGVGIAWNLLCGFPGEKPEWFDAMAALIPGLAHLQPPCIDCVRFRLERFSPSFVDRDSLGLKNVRPNSSYRELYPFAEETVADLAFYFDYEYANQPDPSAYLGALSDAVRHWHGEVGAAAFLSLRGPGSIELLDTRRCAVAPRSVLQGAEAEVYAACEHGADLGALVRSLGLSRETLERVLSSFVERRWMLELDGKFLALAVRMDARAKTLPAYLPRFLRDESLLSFYFAQSKQLFGTYAPDLPSFDVLLSRSRASTG